MSWIIQSPTGRYLGYGVPWDSTYMQDGYKWHADIYGAIEFADRVEALEVIFDNQDIMLYADLIELHPSSEAL